jgi:hypothetical protein
VAEVALILDVSIRLVRQWIEWADEYGLRLYRERVETINSQLESLGLQHLRAPTNEGFDIKVHASLIALRHTQALGN